MVSLKNDFFFLKRCLFLLMGTGILLNYKDKFKHVLLTNKSISTLTPPHQPGSITTTTKIHFGGGNVHHMTGLPTLLQPKVERSDSICSEYSTTTVKVIISIFIFVYLTSSI